MTEREQQILALIRQNPLISQKVLGEHLGISREAAASHIMNLTRKGYVRGKGYLLNDPLEVMVIGGCNLDIQGIPAKAGIAGDSLPGQVSMTPGGVGRNIAENIARLSHEVRMVSVVGADEAGQQLIAATADAGVDVSSIRQLSGRRTSVYLSILDHQHELVQAINDMDTINDLTPEVLADQASSIGHSKALVIDANLTSAALEYLFTRKPLAPVFADCVSASKAEKLKPWLNRIHCLKPNVMEAELLWGKPVKDQQDLKNCAQWFHAQGVAKIFISLGGDGLFASDGQQQLMIKPKPCKVISVSGAGDALMAGLVHSHLKNLDLNQTVDTAQACAAMALTYHSTVNPALSAAAVKRQLRK
ncbi:PfkB family carbohydrate kinase [Pelagibaculum spongiae]|uniref:Kinase n=1 Tax=Pelagibaculum spongiae TaxID=2080658 RepID=A0A2V1GUR1_9GAMM|nr:PfkB family carbohydrate kinase [Pelagibaculum spongiae]PVZ68377.1 kinase [Pelagibaculum spongiae]